MAHPLSLVARWGVFCLLLAAIVAAGAVPISRATATEDAGKLWAYIGTYTGGKGGSKGIYRFDFDPTTGQLSHGELAAEAVNPSFLAIHPNRQYLYAVRETADF